MTDIASVLSILFVLLIAFYVCVHTALTISEVKSAEAGANVVPAAFRPRVSLAEHRKAIDYTGEVIQSDLVAALIGAGIALLLTFGGGFTVLLAGITALCGQGLAAHITLALLISFVLALIDFPLCWWKEFRINERYGFEKTPAKQWLVKALKELILGWCSLAPVLVAVLVICESASYHWWSFALMLTAAWYIWRIALAPKIIGFSAQAKPLREGSLKERLTKLLRRLELDSAEIYTMARPKSWRHGNAIFVKRRGKFRLVIFNHVLARLTDEEICAVAACAIGRINRCHNAARLFFFHRSVDIVLVGTRISFRKDVVLRFAKYRTIAGDSQRCHQSGTSFCNLHCSSSCGALSGCLFGTRLYPFARLRRRCLRRSPGGLQAVGARNCKVAPRLPQFACAQYSLFAC